jgi:Pyridoxamine 5'-phosphate oxidase
VLDRDQCLRLLADEVIGRLAVIAGNTPAIFPVNYALDGDTIVFRTDPVGRGDGVPPGSKVLTGARPAGSWRGRPRRGRLRDGPAAG